VRAERVAGEAQYHAAFADVKYARESIAATVRKSWILAIEAKLQRDLADQIVRAS
jgi:outer membrane protein TolC